MAIITKKIGNRNYAYLVVREGKRVVHRYIGPVGSPWVTENMRDRDEASAVPERFRTLFWDTSVAKIHLKRNATYIIERILELGDVDAAAWLQRVYPGQRIIDTLRTSRVLTEKSRNFWMCWFGSGAA